MVIDIDDITLPIEQCSQAIDWCHEKHVFLNNAANSTATTTVTQRDQFCPKLEA